MENILKSLDKLREERADIKNFTRGCGRFGISIELTLFKNFGCGKHELEIVNKDIENAISQILTHRIKILDDEIKNMLRK